MDLLQLWGVGFTTSFVCNLEAQVMFPFTQIHLTMVLHTEKQATWKHPILLHLSSCLPAWPLAFLFLDGDRTLKIASPPVEMSGERGALESHALIGPWLPWALDSVHPLWRNILRRIRDRDVGFLIKEKECKAPLQMFSRSYYISFETCYIVCYIVRYTPLSVLCCFCA